MPKILLIEDDLRLVTTLHDSLGTHSFKTQSVSTVAQAYEQLYRHKFDLLIIDRQLPDGDGLEIVEYLEKKQIELPTLVLTDRNTCADRIRGLRFGAGDYLGKPFSHDELILRAQNLLKKMVRPDARQLTVGDVTLLPSSSIAVVENRRIALRKKEFEILYFLMLRKNTIVSRLSLCEHLWTESQMPTYTTIDVYVRRLRVLLAQKKSLIHTIRGSGYIVRG